MYTCVYEKTTGVDRNIFIRISNFHDRGGLTKPIGAFLRAGEGGTLFAVQQCLLRTHAKTSCPRVDEHRLPDDFARFYIDDDGFVSNESFAPAVFFREKKKIPVFFARPVYKCALQYHIVRCTWTCSLDDFTIFSIRRNSVHTHTHTHNSLNK